MGIFEINFIHKFSATNNFWFIAYKFIYHKQIKRDCGLRYDTQTMHYYITVINSNAIPILLTAKKTCEIPNLGDFATISHNQSNLKWHFNTIAYY